MTTVEMYKESVREYVTSEYGSAFSKMAEEEVDYLAESLVKEGWSLSEVSKMFSEVVKTAGVLA